jgi:AraC-like DNA-binding protein
MQAARELLLTTNQNAYQIALAIGYQNESHFFRQFRHYHDTTPRNWRKLQREQTPRKMSLKIEE